MGPAATPAPLASDGRSLTRRSSLTSSGRSACSLRNRIQQSAGSRTSHRRSQPQRRHGRLHGLIDHSQQPGRQRVQVDLLTEPEWLICALLATPGIR